MNKVPITFEVCIDSVAGALAAKQGGGDRLELCGDLSVGGVTPDFELVREVLAATDLPIMMMIRPRGGSFIYTPDEIKQMLAEIDAAKKLGVTGVVFGCLTAENKIDVALTQQLIDRARPLSVTIHRAFDEVTDPMQALTDVRNLGADRILTSGLAPTAAEGTDVLKRLIEKAGNVIIMPGAGVRPENARQILAETGATEIHGTASEPDADQPTGKATSADTVRAIREQCDLIAM